MAFDNWTWCTTNSETHADVMPRSDGQGDIQRGQPGCKRVYSNSGNLPLINLLNIDSRSLLDVGCGAGDNARLVRQRLSSCQVFGITYSETEALLANPFMERCWVADVESQIPAEIAYHSYDAIVFSHVLEHLRDPADVVRRFWELLPSGGQILIAVPNVVAWRQRWEIIRGRFEYQASGVMDETHLRFFTYQTADSYLLAKIWGIRSTCKSADGSIPLWLLRRFFPSTCSKSLDSLACRYWPNLFGTQILIKAIKQ